MLRTDFLGMLGRWSPPASRASPGLSGFVHTHGADRAGTGETLGCRTPARISGLHAGTIQALCVQNQCCSLNSPLNLGADLHPHHEPLRPAAGPLQSPPFQPCQAEDAADRLPVRGFLSPVWPRSRSAGFPAAATRLAYEASPYHWQGLFLVYVRRQCLCKRKLTSPKSCRPSRGAGDRRAQGAAAVQGRQARAPRGGVVWVPCEVRGAGHAPWWQQAGKEKGRPLGCVQAFRDWTRPVGMWRPFRWTPSPLTPVSPSRNPLPGAPGVTCDHAPADARWTQTPPITSSVTQVQVKVGTWEKRRLERGKARIKRAESLALCSCLAYISSSTIFNHMLLVLLFFIPLTVLVADQRPHPGVNQCWNYNGGVDTGSDLNFFLPNRNEVLRYSSADKMDTYKEVGLFYHKVPYISRGQAIELFNLHNRWDDFFLPCS